MEIVLYGLSGLGVVFILLLIMGFCCELCEKETKMCNCTVNEMKISRLESENAILRAQQGTYQGTYQGSLYRQDPIPATTPIDRLTTRIKSLEDYLGVEFFKEKESLVKSPAQHLKKGK